MIVARISNRAGTEGYDKDVFSDIQNIFLALQGRLRFKENIAGDFITFTTATANAEVAVPHTLGVIPVGRIVIGQNKAGSLYDSATAATAGKIYVKCDQATVTFKIFLMK
jgi:hypothetical protein